MSRRDGTVRVINDYGPLGWVLFTAWIGAAIYFYQQNPVFGGFLMAVLKAAVWPAYVLYHALGLLGA